MLILGMFDIIFLDFDETLFHTQAFKTRQVEVFERYGVPRDLIWKTFRPVEHDGHGETYYQYTLEKHIKLLRDKGYVLSDKIFEELRKIFKQNYNMEGAEDFIKYLRSISEYLFLLSSGNRKYQMDKITSSGLDKLVSDVIIISDHKEEVVKTLIKKDKKYLFINDNLLENKRVYEQVPEIIVISRMNTVMFTEEEYKISGIPSFYTLQEIQNYVEQTFI